MKSSIKDLKPMVAKWTGKCSVCLRTILEGEKFSSINRQVLCDLCTNKAERMVAKPKKMNKKTRAILASSVECPFCGARKGKHCFNPKNKVRRNWHPERLSSGVARSSVESLVV